MKQRTTEVKWAIIFTVVALLWVALERALGWHDELIHKHAVYTNLFAVVAIALYVFALLDKRHRDHGGYMTWKQGFVSGLLISVGVAVLSPLAQYITHTVVTPDYFGNARAFAMTAGHTDAEAAARHFNLGSYIVQATIGALVLGVVTSALVASVVRRSPA